MQYGQKLYNAIASDLKSRRLKSLGQRNLYLFKDFYLAYPQILQALAAKLKNASG